MGSGVWGLKIRRQLHIEEAHGLNPWASVCLFNVSSGDSQAAISETQTPDACALHIRDQKSDIRDQVRYPPLRSCTIFGCSARPGHAVALSS
jgi:hypothetical protein